MKHGYYLWQHWQLHEWELMSNRGQVWPEEWPREQKDSTTTRSSSIHVRTLPLQKLLEEITQKNCNEEIKNWNSCESRNNTFRDWNLRYCYRYGVNRKNMDDKTFHSFPRCVMIILCYIKLFLFFYLLSFQWFLASGNCSSVDGNFFFSECLAMSGGIFDCHNWA